MKLTALVLTAAATAVTTMTTMDLPATAHADPPPPCSSGQVQVSVAGSQGASGRSVETLMFSLAPGAAPCTLTGYPGVDSGAGGPTIHAERTLYGSMGGVDGPAPPTVTLSPSKPAYARVQGAVIDANGNECPNYTTLLVTPPDTTDTVTVPTDIYFCRFQVHPVTSQP